MPLAITAVCIACNADGLYMTPLKFLTQLTKAPCRNKNVVQSSKLIKVLALQFLTAEFMVTDERTCI